jgi:hypothetical protein
MDGLHVLVRVSDPLCPDTGSTRNVARGARVLVERCGPHRNREVFRPGPSNRVEIAGRAEGDFEGLPAGSEPILDGLRDNRTKSRQFRPQRNARCQRVSVSLRR